MRALSLSINHSHSDRPLALRSLFRTQIANSHSGHPHHLSSCSRYVVRTEDFDDVGVGEVLALLESHVLLVGLGLSQDLEFAQHDLLLGLGVLQDQVGSVLGARDRLEDDVLLEALQDLGVFEVIGEHVSHASAVERAKGECSSSNRVSGGEGEGGRVVHGGAMLVRVSL